MKSMTGYGYGESDTLDGIVLSAEIRTVNRKQLDIKLNLPRELQCKEPEIRRMISSSISRGSVYLKVDFSLGSTALEKTFKINEELAKIIVEKGKTLKNTLELPGEIRVVDILRFPDVVENKVPDLLNDDFYGELFKTIGVAISELNDSRNREGEFLKADMVKRLSVLEKLVSEIEPLAIKLPEYYRAKLEKKLEDEKFAVIDDDRLIRELVIYSDKCDVSEEITRLKSHFIQFKSLINKKDRPVGRSMDFLLQEIQREINTLGVKAASTDISPKVVAFKTEAEKIREQIQNIE